jgi:hypothetical protein
MRDFARHYLEDIDLSFMTRDERDLFLKFVKRYYKELVNIGYLLKDVDFEDLSNEGRRKIIKSSLVLWKTANYDVQNVIM